MTRWRGWTSRSSAWRSCSTSRSPWSRAIRRGWAAGHQVVWGAGYRRAFDEYEASYTLRLMPERRTVHLWSAFAHGEVVPLADRLHLSAGTKVEHNSYTGLELQPNELSFAELDLTRTPPELPVQVANRAKAASRGLELGLDWQVSASWWLRGSYTYLDLDVTVAEDSFDTTTEGYEGESPTHQVGQNLLQTQHREIASSSSGTVHAAVQRGAYVALEWDL